MTNTQILLSDRPQGLPEANTWKTHQAELPDVAPGTFLIENHYISLDPAMRGWINDVRSYIPPVGIGEVMRAGTVGKVLESQHPDYKEGDLVVGWGGVQEYTLADGKGYYKIPAGLAPMQTFLGTLGMPGYTAYFGLLEVGQPKEGETVVVSGGAGAVGSVVGQIAKIKGCRVVGIAGGPKKCSYIVDELGFDAAIDYKNDNLYAKLKETCPKGIDVYFDNVGGDILDTVLTRINRGARIPICGAISQYNEKGQIKGPSNYMSLLVNRARMEGFVVIDYADRYTQAAMEMGGWMAQGKLKTREHIDEGIENFHETFLKLFSGDKMGKLVLKLKNAE